MYTLRIALRYLFARKSHAAVNIISAVSAAVVAVASAAIVIVLSVFNGFTDLAMSQLSVLDPELQVAPVRGKVIENADSLARELASVEGVAAAMPVVEERGLLVDGGHQMPVVFTGVPEGYDRCCTVDSAVVDGVFLTESSGWWCGVAGVGVAYECGLRPSAERFVKLYVPRRVGRISTANPATAFRADSLMVSGVFQVNQPEYDSDHMYIGLGLARNLLDYTTEATAIDIAAEDGWRIAQLKRRISELLGADYRVLDRVEQQETSFRMIAVEKWVTFMMLAFILVIASFNIISTLGMLVLEKRSHLSTLRAMGASLKGIRGIFVWQGWLICCLGGIVGILIGTALTLAQQWGGFVKLNADPSALTVAVYPVRLAATDILVVAAIVALIGFVTSRATAFFIRSVK